MAKQHDPGDAHKPEREGISKKQRRFEILGELRRNGSISVEELSAALEVSVVTIRRDLDDIEQQGVLNRTHGGASPAIPPSTSHSRTTASSWNRSRALPTRSAASARPPPR